MRNGSSHGLEGLALVGRWYRHRDLVCSQSVRDGRKHVPWEVNGVAEQCAEGGHQSRWYLFLLSFLNQQPVSGSTAYNNRIPDTEQQHDALYNVCRWCNVINDVSVRWGDQSPRLVYSFQLLCPPTVRTNTHPSVIYLFQFPCRVWTASQAFSVCFLLSERCLKKSETELLWPLVWWPFHVEDGEWNFSVWCQWKVHQHTISRKFEMPFHREKVCVPFSATTFLCDVHNTSVCCMKVNLLQRENNKHSKQNLCKKLSFPE